MLIRLKHCFCITRTKKGRYPIPKIPEHMQLYRVSKKNAMEIQQAAVHHKRG
jgi:hypothetical protein